MRQRHPAAGSTLLVLSLSAAFPVQAMSTVPTKASWLMPQAPAARENLEKLLADPVAGAFLNSDSFIEIDAQLSSHTSQIDTVDPARVKKLAATAGFTQQNITLYPTSGTPKATCIRLKGKNTQKAVLVTFSSLAQDALWLVSFAAALRSRNITPAADISFCAVENTTAAEQTGILSAIFPKPPTAHIDVSGRSLQVFVNFMGKNETTVLLKEGFSIFPDNHAEAQLAAQTLREAATHVHYAFRENKLSPYLSAEVTDIVCNDSVLGQSCSFRVLARSRSKTQLAEFSESLYEELGPALKAWKTERPAARNVKLFFPENRSSSPFTFFAENDAAVAAWTTATAEGRMPGEFVSSRYIVSNAAFGALHAASGVRVSVTGNTADETARLRNTFARLLLTLVGASTETGAETAPLWETISP